MNEEDRRLECLRMAIQANISAASQSGQAEKSDIALAEEYYEFVSGSKKA